MATSTASSPAVCVLGGTFDPVHFGHLRAAQELSIAFARASRPAETRFVPNRLPPHREAARASGAQREAMLRLAINGLEYLHVDTRELKRDGPSYTIDTLRSLRAELGAEKALVLGVGADAFGKLSSWHEAEKLGEYAHIAVLTRPGVSLDESWLEAMPYPARSVQDAGDLLAMPAGGLYKLEMTPLAISSTRIREQIAGGWSPRFLLPETVCDYIETHGLYQQASQ